MISNDVIDKVKYALLAMQRHSWEQGVTAQAFLELGDLEMTILLAKEAALRQWPDGRLAMVESEFQVSDPGSNGEPLLFAAKATGDPALQVASQKMMDYLLHLAPRAGDGTLYHVTNAPQMWIDSMYMAPPFLVVAGYPDEAIQQIEGLRKRLWNPSKQMYSHIWDEGRQAFIRSACWGVGNGWTAAGLARVIRTLPDEMKDETLSMVSYLKEVLQGCLAFQRPDGLFHDIVDDPTTFVETNLAQMLAYAIFRGIKGGWLEEGYRVAADRMREAVYMKVDEYGLVQGVCGVPDFKRPNPAPEGQAFFLLMEASFRDL